MQDRWILPEGIREILPPHAAQIEALCRRLIDLYTTWGYQFVIPPIIEYLDSLLTGTGKDLDLHTFKLIDQLNGWLMGVRADTTPQVARIDGHHLKRKTPTRLCYLGTILHTRPDNTGATRSPLQVGAELFGHAGIESDIEILCLMIETIQCAGIENIHVDLGHVGIYDHLVQTAKLDEDPAAQLSDVLKRKATPELEQMVGNGTLSGDIGGVFKTLIGAYGPIDEFASAKASLETISPNIKRSLEELQRIIDQVSRRNPDVSLHFDFSELRGYHYHTGTVFTAYTPDHGDGIAFGGRYDNIGSAFGYARPATGFSADIKTLFSLSTAIVAEQAGIWAPCSDDPAQTEAIKRLRDQGEVVICELLGQCGSPQEMDCDRRLEFLTGEWTVVPLTGEADDG